MDKNDFYFNFLNNARYFLREFFAGCVGGWTTTLVGQPWDTIKVRMQTMSHYKNSLDCLYTLIKKEGPLALYKGTLSPLIGTCLCLSLQFGVDGTTKKIIKNWLKVPAEAKLATPYLFISGMCGSFAQLFVITPSEHVRIKMQVQTGEKSTWKYKNTQSCFFEIYKKYGLNGLYRGFTFTFFREVPTGGIHIYLIILGVYLTTYELLCRYFTPKDGSRSDVSIYYFALSGALTGYIYWSISYPFDVLKSKLQADSFSNRKYESLMHCFQETRKEGAKRFFAGLSPCLFRAGPTNAAGFLGFEYTMHFLARNDTDFL